MFHLTGKRVLVTGGAGFIGSHTVEALLKAGFHVIVFDNFSTGKMQNLESCTGHSGTLEILEGDLRDAPRVHSVFRRFKPDVVFHLAAMTSVGGSIEEPQLCDEVNIGGLVNLLRAIEDYKTRKIVFSSTSALYGDCDPPHTENSVFHNRNYLSGLKNPYARSKLIGENLLMRASSAPVIFRFFNVYGERQPVSGGYPAVIPSFLRDIREGAITIYGDGTQSRDFIYAGDVARALVDSIRPGFTGIYNLGSGRGTTIHELAGLIASLSGVDFDVHYEPSRPGEILESYGSISRVRRALGFTPSVDLCGGLGRLLSVHSDCSAASFSREFAV